MLQEGEVDCIVDEDVKAGGHGKLLSTMRVLRGHTRTSKQCMVRVGRSGSGSTRPTVRQRATRQTDQNVEGLGDDGWQRDRAGKLERVAQ